MLRNLAFLLLMVPVCRAGALRAGAASVDITPAADASLLMGGYGARTQGHTGIHDNVFVRAIVLDDGAAQVAIVAWELISVPNAVWAEVSKQVAAESGIRPENLILAAVHNHGAATLGATPASTAEYTKKVEAGAVEAVRRAKSRLQPARFGIGTGAAYLNINRREFFGAQGWWLGYNENGPSNKTVTVLRFEDMTGKPIAFLINYAVHVVVMGPENRRITGDLAGATSRFVEQHYRGKDHPRSDAGPRVRLRPEKNRTTTRRSRCGPAARPAIRIRCPWRVETISHLWTRSGKFWAKKLCGSRESIKTSGQARLGGAQKVVTCPGRQVEAGPRPRADYKFADADPVNIRLGLVMIDNVPLAGVSGEVFTLIHSRLQKESPFANTIMVTHANGSSGYIPNDDGFDQISYEVTSSHLKPGCAEGAIVNGFLEMLRGFK